jgi:ComF family protein
MLERLLNIALPSRCPLCGGGLEGLERGICTECSHTFAAQIEGNLLHLGAYHGRLERAVRALKFGQTRAVAHPIAAALAQGLQQNNWRVDAFVPVPLHQARALERGYNQAQVLARALSKHTQIPTLDALKRTRATKRQARLEKPARVENIRDAFAVIEPVTNLSIALVDDVHTSGATLSEATLKLIEAGAARVRMIVIARA